MTNIKLLHQLYPSSLQNSREILTADAKNLRSSDVGLKFGKYAPCIIKKDALSFHALGILTKSGKSHQTTQNTQR